MKKKALAAQVAVVLTLTAGPVSMPAHAGIPTVDAANLIQNILSGIEQVAQTLKQIEQYQTQLQQYENQLQNTMAPAAYIWDKAQRTMDGLVNAIDTLEYYKNNLGSIDRYLSKFQDVSYYRSSPCYNGGGCTAKERAAMEENRRLASESQKKANDALFRGLDRQQEALVADARRLEQLQSRAQTAAGQTEAIQYANQLASHQSNQPPRRHSSRMRESLTAS